MRAKLPGGIKGVIWGDTFPANGERQAEETCRKVSHGVPLVTRDTLTPSACSHASHDNKKSVS